MYTQEDDADATAPGAGANAQGAPGPATDTGDSDNNGGQDDGSEEMGENQLCVPLSSLAMPGEGDQMENPQPGDKGQVNIEWTLDHVKGDNAYITVDAVNGNKLEESPAEPSEAQQMGELEDMARKMPERY